MSSVLRGLLDRLGKLLEDWDKQPLRCWVACVKGRGIKSSSSLMKVLLRYLSA